MTKIKKRALVVASVALISATLNAFTDIDLDDGTRGSVIEFIMLWL